MAFCPRSIFTYNVTVCSVLVLPECGSPFTKTMEITKMTKMMTTQTAKSKELSAGSAEITETTQMTKTMRIRGATQLGFSKQTQAFLSIHRTVPDPPILFFFFFRFPCFFFFSFSMFFFCLAVFLVLGGFSLRRISRARQRGKSLLLSGDPRFFFAKTARIGERNVAGHRRVRVLPSPYQI